MKERPILVAAIGYIIGILWGLYFTFSIVLLYIPVLAAYRLLKMYLKIRKKNKFQLISFRRYIRYFKLMINRKVVFIFIISSIISNGIVLVQDKQYNKWYQNGENIKITGIIVSQKTEKQYYNLYQVKLLDSKNFSMYIQVDKKLKELEYGDKVSLQGEYEEPVSKRIYGGYDDKQYLKTRKIVGRIKVSKIEVTGKKQFHVIFQLANHVNRKIKERIDKNVDQEKASLLKGILLGDTNNLEEEVKEDFQIAGISHILAISGMHINYIITGIEILFKKLIGKKKTRILIILLLLFYAFITGFSPSIVRAEIMGTITIIAKIVYRKSDIWTSIAISLLVTLWYNPFLILDVGLQLSYLGTIGIVLFRSTILQFFSTIQWNKKIKEILSVSLSAQVMIFPILIYHFNMLGIYFLITNILVSVIIGPILIIGFFSIIISCGSNFFVNIGLQILRFISKVSILPFSKIYLSTPHKFSIILYFIGVSVGKYFYHIYHLEHLTPTHKRIKNLIALIRYRFHEKKKKYIAAVILILIVLSGMHLIPKHLKIHFVDVGQGDCTFIVTPHNKTILVDGGGSIRENFDIGKKTLIPYLLDRGYSKINYMVISHFDQDHWQGLFTIINELQVKKIIIGKQYENSENYEEFVKLVKKKNIKVHVVEAGQRINIEKDLYFDILWPDANNVISDNSINNNSLVCKLVYKNFSMLFTGDIEEKAENAILQKYKNNLNILNSIVLKVAHHGSKTSSIKEFLEAVKPKLALIGVGANNKFGHPSNITLESLKSIGCKIYRTDENGEITLRVNSKGKIWINKMLN